ncbi:hypothetical protein T310_10261 [Rasamsonia emersonii CBS 393.64]|uniref:SNF2 N-terminal domain-containing protein n=1 Tax=Rasamsonia emersonii (strain ATCC 16479 / CBS 393.64 / IMI 116815) TaxID=1408163 RepID=A0A0F4YD94_RASE3|nr:hypothetical protein T310_10261 [Rasamsonia emersonii CBS 393.64]KKA16159.1 hypothetical protein T310_10261 [Rasamsonia emersonii CBS 393.64]
MVKHFYTLCNISLSLYSLYTPGRQLVDPPGIRLSCENSCLPHRCQWRTNVWHGLYESDVSFQNAKRGKYGSVEFRYPPSSDTPEKTIQCGANELNIAGDLGSSMETQPDANPGFVVDEDICKRAHKKDSYWTRWDFDLELILCPPLPTALSNSLAGSFAAKIPKLMLITRAVANPSRQNFLLFLLIAKAVNQHDSWFDNELYQRENETEACQYLGIDNPDRQKVRCMHHCRLHFWQPVAIHAMCQFANDLLLSGCLLADGVGLGKTWTTIAFLLTVLYVQAQRILDLTNLRETIPPTMAGS